MNMKLTTIKVEDLDKIEFANVTPRRNYMTLVRNSRFGRFLTVEDRMSILVNVFMKVYLITPDYWERMTSTDNYFTIERDDMFKIPQIKVCNNNDTQDFLYLSTGFGELFVSSVETCRLMIEIFTKPPFNYRIRRLNFDKFAMHNLMERVRKFKYPQKWGER